MNKKELQIKKRIIDAFNIYGHLKRLHFVTKDNEEYKIEFLDRWKYKDLLKDEDFLNEINYFIFSKKDTKKLLKHTFFEKEDITFLTKLSNKNIDKSKIIKLKNGNIITPDISNHAFEMFVKRFIIFYHFYHKHQENFSKKLMKIYNEKLLPLIEEDNYLKKKENRKKIEQIIREQMQDASVFNLKKTLYRKKDIRNMLRRINKYGSDYKIFNHPFLFILDNNATNVLTIELYSSNFPDLDFLNKFIKNIETKNYLKFKQELEKKI